MVFEKGAYREITVTSVILGILLGSIMTMAFVYAGLKLGFTIGGSTIAAILGFVVLKGILRRGTIVENNINQTVASGVNIASAGIIFTLPALLLMGESFSPYKMMVAAVAGSFLGITVILPLRKQMLEIDRLRFPSGTAVATILKSPGAGIQKAILLGAGFFISMVVVLLIRANILPHEIPLGKWLDLPSYTQTAIAISLMNIGAGMLAGKGGLPFALGGMIAFWVIAPVAVKSGWTPSDLSGEALTGYVYSKMLRPVGIGLLIGGALMGVVVAFPAIRSAFKSLVAATKMRDAGSKEESEEIGVKVLYVGLIFSIIFLFFAAYIGSEAGALSAAAISVVGTLWIAVAGLIVAQCTGITDISPISGLSLIAITIILGLSGGNVVMAVLIGVAVCVATTQCADMMQDLKTGQMVGSIPRKQQMVQYGVAWLGPVIAIITMCILWKTPTGAPGFGPESEACVRNLPDCLSAPQAGALQAMIKGVLSGNVPLDKYISGAITGGVLSILPLSGLGVLIGLAMYLPFSITLGFGVGSLITMAIGKIKSASWVEDKIVPFAAGLIIGEAITELVHSIMKIFS